MFGEKRTLLRILHGVISLDMGGAPFSAAHIACGLQGKGHEVYLVHSSKGGRRDKSHPLLMDMLHEAGVTVLDVPALLRRPAPLLDLVATCSIRNLIKSIRPDVVNTHSAKPGLMMGLAARTLRVPLFVHTERGWAHEKTESPVARRAYLHLERVTARLAHRLVAVTPLLVENGLALGLGSREKYTVIRSGIDRSLFRSSSQAGDEVRREHGIPAAARVVGSVMTLVREKGAEDIARAFLTIGQADPDVHILLVGDGPMRERVLEIASPLEERFHYAGMSAQTHRFYSAMDCILLASYVEGLSRVVMEAMSCGVPVVSTDSGGNRELVIDGRTGFLVRIGDIEGMADRVRRLLQDEPLRLACAREAEALLGREFDVDFVVDAYEQLYQRCLPG